MGYTTKAWLPKIVTFGQTHINTNKMTPISCSAKQLQHKNIPTLIQGMLTHSIESSCWSPWSPSPASTSSSLCTDWLSSICSSSVPALWWDRLRPILSPPSLSLSDWRDWLLTLRDFSSNRLKPFIKNKTGNVAWPAVNEYMKQLPLAQLGKCSSSTKSSKSALVQ